MSRMLHVLYVAGNFTEAGTCEIDPEWPMDPLVVVRQLPPAGSRAGGPPTD